MKKTVLWITFVACAIASVPFLILGTFIVPEIIAEYRQRIPFDSDTWKNQKGSQRIRMVDDLLAKHNLAAMTKPEIDDLLGVPPPTDYFRNFDYVYWLGPERGFISIDSEWLVISFNEDDTVRETKIMTD